MKSFYDRISDEISLNAIEKFSNRLMIKYEMARQQETVGEAVSDVGIGFEIAINILQRELNKAREELSDGCTEGSRKGDE